MADCTNEAAFTPLQGQFVDPFPCSRILAGQFHWIEILSKKYRTPIPLKIILSSFFNMFMDSFTNKTRASSYWNAWAFLRISHPSLQRSHPSSRGIYQNMPWRLRFLGLWCFFSVPPFKIRCPTLIFVKRVNQLWTIHILIILVGGCLCHG